MENLFQIKQNISRLKKVTNIQVYQLIDDVITLKRYRDFSRVIKLKKGELFMLDPMHNDNKNCIKLCSEISEWGDDRYYHDEIRVYSDFNKYFKKIKI